MITQQMVYDLEMFRYDNVQPEYLRQYLDIPNPPEDPDAERLCDDEHLRKIIAFAAQLAPRDWSALESVLPRQLAAMIVLDKIPEEDGVALFGLDDQTSQ